MAGLLSEVWGDVLPELPLSLADHFHQTAQRYPNNTALVCAHQDTNLYGVPSIAATDKYLRWSFQSLYDGVQRCKAGLVSLGAQQGASIITLLPNCAEFVLVWWAAVELGAVIVPLDPRRLSNIAEGKHMVQTGISAAAESSSTPPIIIAASSSLFEGEVLKSQPALARIVVTSAASPASTEHVPFESLLQVRARVPQGESSSITSTTDDASTLSPRPRVTTILFTSGSTSLPKGVWWPESALAALAYRISPSQDPDYKTVPGDLWCTVTHSSHVIGLGSIVGPLLGGAGVLYPGATFSPQPTAEALAGEPCTHMILVPAMVAAIAEAAGGSLRADAGGSSTLKAVVLGGSPVSAQHVQMTLEELGAHGVLNGYGSTEGVSNRSAAIKSAQDISMRRGQLSVGRPSAGGAIRICALGGSRDALPRGVAGEIHFGRLRGLPSVYVGREDTDDVCYADEQGTRWFVTGDEGIMDEAGNLYVVGRIKDMIIRGGENISPAAIESCLAEVPSLKDVVVHVVGQPDPFAEEVPVAIIGGKVDDLKQVAAEIHKAVIANMGPIWNPQEVIHMSELGLDDWPRTTIGKIHKPTLRDLVLQRHASIEEASERAAKAATEKAAGSEAEGELRDEILSIWARAVGLEASSLPLDSAISNFADSLLLARVRGELKRHVDGLEGLSAQDILESDTLSTHLDKMLGKLTRGERVARNKEPASVEEKVEQGPPKGAEDMIHALDRPELFDTTKQLVTRTIAKHGFSWDDVADVFPAQGFIDELSRHGVLDSSKFQNSHVAAAGVTKEDLRTALEAMLRANRILPSFLVWDETQPGLDQALHVTMKPSQRLYDDVLRDGGFVDTEQDLSKLASEHPHPEWTLFPGILFRALLYTVKETGRVGFLISVSHGVMDATYSESFMADLDRALSSKPAIRPHVRYKTWAESYYSFKDTPQARASAQWQARHLHGLHDHLQKTQWPRGSRRAAFDPSGRGYGNGAHRKFQVPGLVDLRREHPDITVPMVVKTALSLFNVAQTGHDHAVFSGVQAGRTAWPFLPNSLSRGLGMLDEATDVAGPLVQSVTNLIKVSQDETVLEMLNRLQEEQRQITQHAHAPWSLVEAMLDQTATATAGLHKGINAKIFTSQIFNWVPGMGARAAGLRKPFDNFTRLATMTRWQVGVIVRAGVGGAKNDEIYLHLLGDGLTDDKMDEMTQKLEIVVKSLTDPANWLQPVSTCLSPELKIQIPIQDQIQDHDKGSCAAS